MLGEQKESQMKIQTEPPDTRCTIELGSYKNVWAE